MYKLYFVGFLCVVIWIANTNGMSTSSVQIENAGDITPLKKTEQTSKPALSKKSIQTEAVKFNSEINTDNIAKVGKLVMNSFLQSLANDRSAGTLFTVTKQAIILKVTQILQIIFYATGSVFFVCSIIDCKSIIGGGGGSGLFGGGGTGGYGGGSGGGPFSSIFSRNDFDSYVNHQGKPIVRQIKTAQQLYQ